MFPIATSANTPDRFAGDAKQLSDFAICHVAVAQVADFPDHSHIVFCKFCIRVSLAALLSLFAVAITIIVSHCADEQMFNGNAGRIITRMEDPKTFRYRAHEGLIGNPMRQPFSDSAVPVIVARSRPFKTSVRCIVQIRAQDSTAIVAMLLLRPASPKEPTAESARCGVFIVPSHGKDCS